MAGLAAGAVIEPGGRGAGIGSDAIPVGPGTTRATPDEPPPGRVTGPALPLSWPVGPTVAGPSSAGPTTVRPSSPPGGPSASLVAIPIAGGSDPVFAALRDGAPSGVGALDGDPRLAAIGIVDPPAPTFAQAAEAAALATRPTAVAVAERPVAAAADSSRGGKANRGGSADPADQARCAEERRLADERCELATRARTQADAALDALRSAQRAYDAHEAAALDAAVLADPRAIHAAKESAQGGFRAAVKAADDPDALEAAARDWLTEINRINTDARDAATRAAKEHAAAVDIATTLERLGLEADAARIAADNADAACLAARQAVADCDERSRSISPDADGSAIPVPAIPGLEEDETLGIALESGSAPRIFRLLHGDRAAMTTVVARLAGDDAEARRRWQLQLTGLIEAIIADAIEAAYLEFPLEHTFWGAFTRSQNRDITQALSSLGFRFDGLGGWTDGRYPSQRDLSLALGYAGIDPMRVRNWPNEEATANLFQDVTVAADEYLAGVAGDLTLAEMVTMLGRRADGLAEVWNQWGHIRPLLLEEA
jgi:hypothetical protein